VAFPTVVSSTTTSETTQTTSPVFNLPGSLVVGNTLLMIYRCAQSGAITVPGFTELGDSGTDAADDQIVWAWRKVDGTEGSTITLTTGSGRGAGICWQIQGGADPAIMPPETSTIAIGTTTAPNATTCTPTGGAKDYLWFTMGGWSGEQTVTPTYPTDYTLYQLAEGSGTAGSVTTNVRVAGAARELNAASTDAGAFTIDVAPAGWSAMTVAIHPGFQSVGTPAAAAGGLETAGTGSLVFTGTATGAAGGLETAGTGTVTGEVTGTGTAEAGGLETAGTGTYTPLAITGTGECTAGGLETAGTGSLTFSGTGTAEAGGLETAGTGALEFTGSGTAEAGGLETEGEGALVFTGVGACEFGGLETSGSEAPLEFAGVGACEFGGLETAGEGFLGGGPEPERPRTITIPLDDYTAMVERPGLSETARRHRGRNPNQPRKGLSG
jgi:hypothetical protein